MINLFFEFILKHPNAAFESFCVIPPILLGLLRKKFYTQYLGLVWLICLLTLMIDIPMWYLAIQKKNNYFWYNTQEIVTSLLWICTFLFLQEAVPKKLIYGALVISLLVALFDFQKLTYSSHLSVCNRLIYISLSFIFFFKLLQDLKVKNILTYPPFWIISGLSIFSSGTVLFFIFTELTLSYKNPSQDVYLFYYHLSEGLKVLLMCFVFIGFWVSKFKSDE